MACTLVGVLPGVDVHHAPRKALVANGEFCEVYPYKSWAYQENKGQTERELETDCEGADSRGARSRRGTGERVSDSVPAGRWATRGTLW